MPEPDGSQFENRAGERRLTWPDRLALVAMLVLVILMLAMEGGR